MEKEKKGFFSSLIKATFLSVILSLIFILIFALVINKARLSNGVIKAVNQFIKVISIFSGCFFTLKKSKGLISGIIVGALFGIFINLVFLIMGGKGFYGLWYIDLIFCSVIGGLSGILSVNMRKD